MRNKAFKIVLSVFIGLLVFGALFAQASTNEETLKILQSLVQMLMQIVLQLQQRITQLIGSTTSTSVSTTSSTTVIPNVPTTIPPLTLKVISPNGGEQIKFGSLFTISWSSSGVNTASIYLWFPDGGTCKIADVPASQGSYSAIIATNQQCPNISKTIIPGQYKIFIASDNPRRIEDESDDWFTLISSPVCTDSDGGKNIFTKGSIQMGVAPYLASYTDDCVSSNTVREFYCENSGVGQNIYLTCPNGYFCDNGLCKAIASYSLKVVSPNGGESYAPGQTIPIAFTTTLTDKQASGFTFQLYKKTTDSFGKMYAQDIVRNWYGGSPYNWTIPLAIAPGEYFIYGAANLTSIVPLKELYDFSDAPFTIGEWCERCSDQKPCTLVRWHDRNGGCDDDWYNQRTESIRDLCAGCTGGKFCYGGQCW